MQRHWKVQGRGIAWQPDGAQLATVQPEGMVALVDRNHVRVRPLAIPLSAFPAATTWENDEYRLAVSSTGVLALAIRRDCSLALWRVAVSTPPSVTAAESAASVAAGEPYHHSPAHALMAAPPTLLFAGPCPLLLPPGGVPGGSSGDLSQQAAAGGIESIAWDASGTKLAVLTCERLVVLHVHV